MIVRNKESNLGDCLRTVRDLVDEVVVVDTGSHDRTREIAKSFDARIVDFPWIDDFSAARNESLQHATSDWIFWMDADDRLDALNRERFKRLRPALPDGAFTFMMKQRSVPEQAGNSPLVVDHARLFRRNPEVRWRYRLHEQILPSLRDAGTKMVFTDLVIDHLGYSHSATRRAKLDRNLRILQLDLRDRPDDAFVAFNMAGTLLDMGQHPQAVPHLETCIRLVPKGASFAPKAHVLLVKSNRSLGQIDEAERRLAVAKELFPRSVELLFEEGLLHQMRGNHSAARLAFEAILSLEKTPQFVGIDEGVSGHLARHNHAQSLRNLGETAAAEAQWRTAIRRMPQFSPAWLSLLELLLAQKRFADAEALARSAEHPRQLPALPGLRARLLLAQNQSAAAIQVLETALEVDPTSQWLRLLLCDVLSRDASQVNLLKHHLQQVLAYDPHHAIARAKLSELAKAIQPN
ncbi:MAG: glycosyltransferase [Gemmataceae bacterium]